MFLQVDMGKKVFRGKLKAEDNILNQRRREALKEAQRKRREKLAAEGYKAITVHLPGELLADVDHLVSRKAYPGRAEVIEKALRKMLK